ncbi:hypothetical protein ACFT30_06665 [Microbacterium ureisolvens]|uniref:hypothetical protein n=1 Tax=Microbacterium TaxID=33882 RepID=UPI002C331A32|nr:hypothetical protein [Microbacterium sp.]
MSQHTFDIAQLRELETTLSNLVQYCTDLETHAAGATAAATGQWSGVASVEFLTRVQTWQVGAVSLRAFAEDLKTWAGDAATAYETAQTDTQTMWASL